MAPPRPVSFRIDEDLMAWVRETADAQHCTLSAVVAGALIQMRDYAEAGGDVATLIPDPKEPGHGRGTPRRKAPAKPKPEKPSWA